MKAGTPKQFDETPPPEFDSIVSISPDENIHPFSVNVLAKVKQPINTPSDLKDPTINSIHQSQSQPSQNSHIRNKSQPMIYFQQNVLNSKKQIVDDQMTQQLVQGRCISEATSLYKRKNQFQKQFPLKWKQRLGLKQGDSVNEIKKAAFRKFKINSFIASEDQIQDEKRKFQFEAYLREDQDETSLQLDLQNKKLNLFSERCWWISYILLIYITPLTFYFIQVDVFNYIYGSICFLFSLPNYIVGFKKKQTQKSISQNKIFTLRGICSLFCLISGFLIIRVRMALYLLTLCEGICHIKVNFKKFTRDINMQFVFKAYCTYCFYIHLLTCYYCGFYQTQYRDSKFITYLNYLQWSLSTTSPFKQDLNGELSLKIVQFEVFAQLLTIFLFFLAFYLLYLCNKTRQFDFLENFKSNDKTSIMDKVKSYYYRLQEEEEENIIEQNVYFYEAQINNKVQYYLQLLPLQYRKDILKAQRLSLLEKIPFLSQNFSKLTMLELTYNLQEIILNPQEFIYQKCPSSQQQENGFYIVTKGNVEIYDEPAAKSSDNQRYLLKILKPGQIFGLESIFGEKGYHFTAKSQGYCKVLAMGSDQFVKILRNNRKDWEKFHLLRNEVIYKQNYSALDIQCYICKKKDHLSSTCPSIHYIPNYDILRYRFAYTKPQERKFIRRKTDKIRNKTIKDQPKVLHGVKAFLNYSAYEQEISDAVYTDELEISHPQNDTLRERTNTSRQNMYEKNEGVTPREYIKDQNQSLKLYLDIEEKNDLKLSLRGTSSHQLRKQKQSIQNVIFTDDLNVQYQQCIDNYFNYLQEKVIPQEQSQNKMYSQYSNTFHSSQQSVSNTNPLTITSNPLSHATSNPLSHANSNPLSLPTSNPIAPNNSNPKTIQSSKSQQSNKQQHIPASPQNNQRRIQPKNYTFQFKGADIQNDSLFVPSPTKAQDSWCQLQSQKNSNNNNQNQFVNSRELEYFLQSPLLRPPQRHHSNVITPKLASGLNIVPEESFNTVNQINGPQSAISLSSVSYLDEFQRHRDHMVNPSLNDSFKPSISKTFKDNTQLSELSPSLSQKQKMSNLDQQKSRQSTNKQFLNQNLIELPQFNIRYNSDFENPFKCANPFDWETDKMYNFSSYLPNQNFQEVINRLTVQLNTKMALSKHQRTN